MTTDNFCFYLQSRLNQTSQTGGQWYSDTSLFSIPWYNIQLMILILRVQLQPPLEPLENSSKTKNPIPTIVSNINSIFYLNVCTNLLGFNKFKTNRELICFVIKAYFFIYLRDNLTIRFLCTLSHSCKIDHFRIPKM
jgi:hypothetical protein